MRAQNFGKIVNISSIGGKISTPLAGWYHASKFALEGYSDALWMEVEPFGIDVIVIEPGGTDTEWIPIALAEAQRYSGQGAYGPVVSSMLNSNTWKRTMPPPQVITQLLVKALAAKRPKNPLPRRSHRRDNTFPPTILIRPHVRSTDDEVDAVMRLADSASLELFPDM